MILLGRLSLHGERAARLHDEIVPVTARRTDAETRRDPLRPHAEDATEKTLALLEASLADQRLHLVSETVTTLLTASVERDVTDLLPHLESRAEILAKRLVERVKVRGEREAKEMKEILESQRARISQTLQKHDQNPQLSLGLDEFEKRQVEADRKHWQKRLTEIGIELETEPYRIRNTYDVRATRIEPVGIVYLWPISG